jgi:hypothetical protein
VAGKYFLAALAQPGPVLLQALLNRSIIAQLLSAKALRISSAGLLLLWRAHEDSEVSVSKITKPRTIERITISYVEGTKRCFPSAVSRLTCRYSVHFT